MFSDGEGRLRELFVFVVEDDKGNQDILAVELDGQWTPLICVTAEQAAVLVRVARRLVDSMTERTGANHQVRIVRFERPQDVTERFMHTPLPDDVAEVWETLYPFDVHLDQNIPDEP